MNGQEFLNKLIDKAYEQISEEMDIIHTKEIKKIKNGEVIQNDTFTETITSNSDNQEDSIDDVLPETQEETE